MSNILVVGGVPNPVGGVTNFIYRLLENNLVSKLADFYFSTYKSVPKEFQGETYFYKTVLSFICAYMFSRKLLTDVDVVHFNFSSPIALVFIFLLPKKGRVFHLTLHHGKLASRLPSIIISRCLNKIDVIYSLSEVQREFYLKNKAAAAKIVNQTSYLPIGIPSGSRVDQSVKSAVDSDVSNLDFVVISGYCQRIYNHHWVVELFSSLEKSKKLLVFLYGDIDSEYFQFLKSKVGDERVMFFVNKDADSFNYALSRSKYYLRPTATDSFGIAVADAVNFGLKVLASDVCTRYPGTYIFTPTSYDSFVSAYLELIKKRPNLEITASNSTTAFSYEL